MPNFGKRMLENFTAYMDTRQSKGSRKIETVIRFPAPFPDPLLLYCAPAYMPRNHKERITPIINSFPLQRVSISRISNAWIIQDENPMYRLMQRSCVLLNRLVA